MRKLSRRAQWLTQLGLAAVGLFVLTPVWGLAYLAFDRGVKGWPTTFRLWPEQLSLDVFQRVWENPAQTLSFLGLLRNSVLVSGGAALLSVGLGVSLAYAFARYRFPGRSVGLFMLLAGTLLPPVALMTPLYILLTALGLRSSQLGLMLVYTSFSMPFCAWNMRAAFQAVPFELEESAFLDGASAWTAFWRVSLPLARPAIAVAAVLAFLTGYTEFALGWLFVSKGNDVTLAMALSGLLDNGFKSWSNIAALSLLTSVPVAGLLILLQRYWLDGVLANLADA